jgi:hypothetical protein
MKSKTWMGPLLVALFFVSAKAFSLGTIADEETIPYKTAQEAIAALKAQPNLILSHDGLWDSYHVPDSGAYWMVFRTDSSFYPSVVRRRLNVSLKGAKFKTAVLCNATADACARLNRLLFDHK